MQSTGVIRYFAVCCLKSRVMVDPQAHEFWLIKSFERLSVRSGMRCDVAGKKFGDDILKRHVLNGDVVNRALR